MPTPIYRIKWPNRSIFRSLKSRKCILSGGYFFSILMKKPFEPIIILEFLRWIRIRSPNRPKPAPKPDFDQFSKKSDFLKNRQKFPRGPRAQKFDPPGPRGPKLTPPGPQGAPGSPGRPRVPHKKRQKRKKEEVTAAMGLRPKRAIP